MQMIDAVVGRMWLGTASCVSSCGKRGKLVWPRRPNASQQKNILGARYGVTQDKDHLLVLKTHQAVGDDGVHYRAECDRSEMQGSLQPSVVRTHPESQARVGQTPHCMGGGYVQNADSTGLIDERKVAC